jgi:hypothetical protein
MSFIAYRYWSVTQISLLAAFVVITALTPLMEVFLELAKKEERKLAFVSLFAAYTIVVALLTAITSDDLKGFLPSLIGAILAAAISLVIR